MIFTPPTTANNYFIMYGKIFFICQHFEKLCKSFVFNFYALDNLSKGKLDLRDFINGGVFINRKGDIITKDKAILGSIIKNNQKKLKEIFGDNVFIEKLIESIDNRNYIIHESLQTSTSFIKNDLNDKSKIEDTFNKEIVLQKLTTIIESIYYFLVLEYEFNEKEPYFDKEQKKHYTKLLMRWVTSKNSKLNGENILIISRNLSTPRPFYRHRK